MSQDSKEYYFIEDKERPLKQMVKNVREMWAYLLKKWVIILIFGLAGGAIGLVMAIMTKPRYTAHLSFALIEKSSSSGLASLASSFGLGGFSNSDGAFSGDNLLEIIQSRHAIEKTLLSPVVYHGKKQNLVEVYITFNKLRKRWVNTSPDKALHVIAYPVGQKRETFTRLQDSILFTVYDAIIKSQALVVGKSDIKLGIVNVDMTTEDEDFSKLFTEKLMDETYQFYSETRTAQSRDNINLMQTTADSIKRLYESALYRSAAISQVNLNAAMQTAAVPKIQQEANAKLYGTVYAEVLKNLETLKMDLAREKPIVQIIDTPILPLKKLRASKRNYVVTGGLWGGFLIVFWLLGSRYFRNALKEQEEQGL
jgi:hypothetical protein